MQLPINPISRPSGTSSPKVPTGIWSLIDATYYSVWFLEQGSTMSLVEYSDSESEKEDPGDAAEVPRAKKRKVSTSAAESLPPLPATFLDQYSSTVRTSNKDDPSLHGGRKRITPHVQGQWPTHVYLECKWAAISHSISLYLHSFYVNFLASRTMLIQVRAPNNTRARSTRGAHFLPTASRLTSQSTSHESPRQ